MLYEAERGDLDLIAVGDALISRPARAYREQGYLELVRLLRSGDVTFANLEMLFHRWEHPPAQEAGGTYMGADPAILEDLAWMGIQLVSCANNHAGDYGPEGLMASLEAVRRAGLVPAGAGPNLAMARAPAYLETRRGRVALLACTSTGPQALRAGAQRPDLPGRPGVSYLGHRVTYVVDRPTLDALRRASKALGLEALKGWRRRFGFYGPQPEDTEEVFHFLGHRFALGEGFRVETEPDPADLEDILRWVRDARRMADWVLVSIHCHEVEPADPYEPARERVPAFLRTFAHRCIDDGADAVLGHGPHLVRGVEVYRGRPILYSLGNFFFQNETVLWQPAESYARFGLGPEHTPADFYDARSACGERGFPPDPVYWESVVARIRFQGGRLEEVRLYPIDLGFGRPRSQRGRPVLAGPEVGRRVLERIARLSEDLGTPVRLEGGTAVVRPEG